MDLVYSQIKFYTFQSDCFQMHRLSYTLSKVNQIVLIRGHLIRVRSPISCNVFCPEGGADVAASTSGFEKRKRKLTVPVLVQTLGYSSKSPVPKDSIPFFLIHNVCQWFSFHILMHVGDKQPDRAFGEILRRASGMGR